MLEITIQYQDREIGISRPGTKYGSNLNEFAEILSLALESIGLRLDGTITEIGNENSNGTVGTDK